MKKVLLFVVVVFAASFASCKKEYDCKCSLAGVETINSVGKTTESLAETACKKLEIGGTTCEIVEH